MPPLGDSRAEEVGGGRQRNRLRRGQRDAHPGCLRRLWHHSCEPRPGSRRLGRPAWGRAGWAQSAPQSLRPCCWSIGGRALGGEGGAAGCLLWATCVQNRRVNGKQRGKAERVEERGKARREGSLRNSPARKCRTLGKLLWHHCAWIQQARTFWHTPAQDSCR